MSKMSFKRFRTYSLIRKQVIDILEITVSILLEICTFVHPNCGDDLLKGKLTKSEVSY